MSVEWSTSICYKRYEHLYGDANESCLTERTRREVVEIGGLFLALPSFYLEDRVG